MLMTISFLLLDTLYFGVQVPALLRILLIPFSGQHKNVCNDLRIQAESSFESLYLLRSTQPYTSKDQTLQNLNLIKINLSWVILWAVNWQKFKAVLLLRYGRKRNLETFLLLSNVNHALARCELCGNAGIKEWRRCIIGEN
jgi:hypothetical protein